ncbi:DsrE family protein [Methanosalsum natronophilum]|uniref:Peroxiredoxin n=1 Tax=Methanosalsum natronophilum TaxID=768733 RepID=A0A3R7VVA7_9EURY|nr:DsrE family protein [Methanosalsum natronophilum]MCS3923294.1 putative peroxiredoxin [Methanosalsum natronophilum]RQD92584.1 MAG: peroxiredoxin [Methanosalsum natronophilum]
MGNISKVLLILKNMVYESTSPQEIIRMARYYQKKGIDVTVVLFGPMGAIFGKKNKHGAPSYDEKISECIDIGVEIKCCDLAASMVGLKQEELIKGIEIVPSHELADLFLEYHENNNLILTF